MVARGRLTVVGCRLPEMTKTMVVRERRGGGGHYIRIIYYCFSFLLLKLINLPKYP